MPAPLNADACRRLPAACSGPRSGGQPAFRWRRSIRSPSVRLSVWVNPTLRNNTDSDTFGLDVVNHGTFVQSGSGEFTLMAGVRVVNNSFSTYPERAIALSRSAGYSP